MKNKNDKESMYIDDIKELAGLLIEYKYALNNRMKKSNNESFKDEIRNKIYNINNVLCDFGMPTYNEQYLKVQNETNN